MLRTFSFLFLLFANALLFSQATETEIGQWKEHVPYQRGNSVVANNNIVYCGSEAQFIAYNMNSGEMKRYTTINGLSDIGVRLLDFNQSTGGLLVAYKNGNLDILEGDKITNIISIKDAEIIADKTIFNIRMHDELAYISTGFGIVVLNMKRKEIKDTYLIGKDSEPLTVYDVVIVKEEETIYAATAEGVRKASLSDNLSDFNSWSKLDFLPEPDASFTHIDYFSGKLVLNQQTSQKDTDLVYLLTDTVTELFEEASNARNYDLKVQDDRILISRTYEVIVYDKEFKRIIQIYEYGEGVTVEPNSCIQHKDNYWMSDRRLGLVRWYQTNEYEVILPNGPNTLSIHDMDVVKGIAWTTSGIMDAGYRGSPNLPEFNKLENLEWTGISRRNESKLDSVYGYIKVVINPRNPKQVFMASWDNGLIEILDGKVNRIFNMETQALYGHALSPIQGSDKLIRVGGMAFDDDGNLWITNSENIYGLCVMKADGTWLRYDLRRYLDGSTIVGDLVISDDNRKWILLNRASSNYRLVVFDNGDEVGSAYQYTALSTDELRGSIPGSTVHCITKDKSGAIWIGSDEGPAVFFSPQYVFETQLDAQQIFVQQDGQTQILLETEDIKSITIDGANRKWFGTSNSGAFLMSSDATKEVNHFTKENSPLFSNEVNNITINHENGEVYFCTSEGLISYKGTATEGGSGFSSVEVFPNPVNRDYTGLIAIKGLSENSNVKITDASGVLIFETTAYGGQAVWDGYSLSGNKAKNGIYLIFCTDPLGENQEVAKLLYLNN